MIVSLGELITKGMDIKYIQMYQLAILIYNPMAGLWPLSQTKVVS